MKKILFPIIVLALVSAASCTKVSSPTNYWSFNGIVYNVGTCTNSNGQIYVLNTDNTNSLTLTFAAGSSPVAPGTYTVLGGLGATPGVGQVSLSMTIGTSGQTYYSTIESVAERAKYLRDRRERYLWLALSSG